MKNKIIKGQYAPYILIIAIIFIIAFLFFYRENYLTLNNRNKGIYIVGNESDEFSISFRHSVNKGIVIENYIVDYSNKKIFLDTAKFESYGAGMLDEVEENMQFTTDEKMQIIKYEKKLLDRVSYLPAGIAKHKFNYKNTELDLYDLFGSSSITIEVKNFNFMEYIYYRWRMI